jgi:hypothetical protein
MDTIKNFSGKVLFLDRADINTDEIIAAKYLTEISKKALGPHLFEDIKLDGFDMNHDISGKNVIVSRANFGCGSSREHAPGHWRPTQLIWSLRKALPVSSDKICLTAECWQQSCRHLPSIISFNPTLIKKQL